MFDDTYMSQYYDGIIEIVQYILDKQITNICEAMSQAYRTKSSGGKIYSHVLVGHFAMFAASPGIPGQPFVLPQRADRNIAADYKMMNEGDFLLTNGPSLVNPDKSTIPEVGPNEARVRGVYTVGITNSYVKFYKTPVGALVPVKMLTSIEDVSDFVIDSGCPWDCGLISTPDIEQFRILSSSGISQFLVYWACTASLCKQIETSGADKGVEIVKEYLNQVLRSFEQIKENEFTKINVIAQRWTDQILRYKNETPRDQKPRLLVYGHPQEGKIYETTKNMFVNDAYKVAAGTMIAEPYEMYCKELKNIDIVLIGAISPDNSEEIKVAQHAKEIGAYTVAFGPFAEGHLGNQLSDYVDDAINTYSGDGGGVLEITGFDDKVCPVSGLSGDLVLWLLTAQWTYHMVQRGETPYFWQNYLEVGASDYDDTTYEEYQKRGY
ncbi:hypothetical protein [Okeania sp. SIO1I7]|uniref:hypothetical protein n=1 Tax=Okeania sp. SIO1I7 TaxID=2607772 RepID=UPI0013F7DC3D|nr:hypothetical protein [Okeania sp. SIO1I7]NET27801.1 hypothetical protein [Okeania sp. SIO1I7]